ncbi:MAG TPA: hypothetical protein VLA22_06660 [Gaiellaceae bacterium]|nr:hypothetical protein [Gaiellaceae bacterium]
MRRRALLAAALVTAVHALVATAAGADRAPPPLSKLLARHVPILVLHPAELLRPVAVDGYLADSDLQRQADGGWENVSGPLPAGGSDMRLDQRLCRAVDGPAATTCYAQAQAAHGVSPVVYGAAFRRGARIDLQYWIWYPYNPYSPTVPPGELWQVHEGDWEAVSVILDRRGKPLAAGYSQHGEGKRRNWVKVPKQGTRPIAYVALGSHANYFTRGVQPFDPRVVEPLLISLIEQGGFDAVDRTGAGRRLRPRVVRVTARTPSWMAFAGRWGEAQYIRAPGGVPQVFGGSPARGPAFHEQWRSPVKEVLSWPKG